MNRSAIVGFIVITLCLAVTVSSAADVRVGRVKSFKGTARVLSGDQIEDIKVVGQRIKSGDRIQTEQGSVEIQFQDGAQLKVDPFSVVGITENVEKKGIFFKSRQDTRRVTANTGTAFFKSGKGSKKKNYLQTPTAACGLRGSAASWGNGKINQTEGSHNKKGDIKNGEPKPNTRQSAQNNPVYKAIQNAANAFRQAGSKNVRARVAIAQAKQKAAQSMLNNPDPAVKKQSKAENSVAGAALKVIDAQQALQRARDAAERSTNAKEAESARKAVADIEKNLQKAAEALDKATDALTSGDYQTAMSEAQDSQELAADAETNSEETTATVEPTTTTTDTTTTDTDATETQTSDSTSDPLPVGTTYESQ